MKSPTQDADQAGGQGQRPEHLLGPRQDGRQDDGGFLGNGQAEPAQNQDEGDPEVAEMCDDLLRQPRLLAAGSAPGGPAGDHPRSSLGITMRQPRRVALPPEGPEPLPRPQRLWSAARSFARDRPAERGAERPSRLDLFVAGD